jgi:hypothetical protein
LLSLGAAVLGMVGLSAAWWGWLLRPLGWRGRGLVGLAGAGFLAWAAIPP